MKPSSSRSHAAPEARDVRAFEASRLRLDDAPPSPLPRLVLRVLFALLSVIGIALAVGRLDVVAVAEGRLVPRTLLKIVQPADAGVVREILVEEGMPVVAGQPLVRLDARLVDADVRAQRNDLALRRLQIKRIDAELDGGRLARGPDDPTDLFARTAAQLDANRAAQADAVAQATAQVERLEQELLSASETERKLARTVPIAQTVAMRYERLRGEGFVSELYALERERERIEREQELRAQRHAVRALEAGLQQARRHLAQVRSGYRRQLHAERAEAASQAVRLGEELDKQLVRREQVELVAPQAGTVKDVAIGTHGTVVAAGTVLVTLVPAEDPLEAEVVVRNEDAGFVKSGQSAQVKIAAFPFQKYGLLAGQVIRVGPDALQGPPQRGENDALPVNGYRARLSLVSQSLAFENAQLALVAGMQANAEIHLGRRPLLEYLLAPVRKAWHEAGRER